MEVVEGQPREARHLVVDVVADVRVLQLPPVRRVLRLVLAVRRQPQHHHLPPLVVEAREIRPLLARVPPDGEGERRLRVAVVRALSEGRR